MTVSIGKESMQDAEGMENKAGEKHIDLDYVLVHELGQFGRFQLINTLLVSIPIIMSAFMSEFIFGAAAIPHRCRIPECGEDSKTNGFRPDWIFNAIPQVGTNNFASCERFASVGNGTLDMCPIDLFDRDVTTGCEAFVYDRTDSVVYDFDLGCQEWMRALAGTLNAVGTLLVLPITGYISDRFGRRVALIINVFNLALFGIIRAFSVNYPMYLALQIIQTTLGAGTFSSAYIFAAELVGPKYRVLASATSTSMFALGQVVLGGTAWLIPSWRYLLLALNIPCFLIISYYWILSESVRWLLSKEKFEEAKIVLEKVARVNRKVISEKSMQALLTPAPPPPESSLENKDSLVKAIFKSPILLRRVCTTPIWWITTILVYYGLSINSTELSEQRHLNYILTVAIEIPGFYSAVLILDRIGRRITLCGGYFLSAACNIAFAFIPQHLAVLRLVIFLLGKFGISVVMTSMYLYTSELYPTQYRHSLLGFSSMIGRIGSITAPLTPVLADYWHGIPSMMFGTLGFISAVLVLTQPETLGTKMPDTLAEAEAIGRKK
ncbi:unnamed protein product [Diatraea saccharalis]|uniref:Major facilitator superfamily (MFS) profile domain-containing protein n=1 Tax=Diatraea saccharalis TaxID=40085 RepID=A0A9N9WDK1_9NEOP|nr:unnamed protein product [Diatraea saccharalis]